MPLSPKTRLGTYEIVGPIGAGGMGEVYRAKDLRLGRDVAVKVLPAEVAASPDRLARFEREARTVAGLNHPNIVTLFSVEDEDGIRFLTMELVDGQTLSDLITPGGIPLSRLLELAIPLTDALVAAHERGVIHRDLKPANVMVTRDGRVKVLDFGLAKIADTEKPAPGATIGATADSPISGEGQVLGTVLYMAPEQLRGDTVDARSDLFALGIILYELATGRRPFTGETSIDIGHAILRDTPEPLSRVRTDLPADLERIVSRCLQKNPRERSQTALDVSNELRSIRRVLERGEPEKPAAAKVASIAVLPFVNRSASADDEYFSEGLADELLNVLAKIKGLRVSARASSFHFKGKDLPLGEIGRALNVATVLDGSVRKSGNRVRISVQLVKISDGFHLWSETYDRTLDDIFAVQDDIAQSVVKELRTRLLGEEAGSDASGRVKAEVARAAMGRTTDAEAHRLYLQARNLIDRSTAEDMAKGIGYLKQALRLDPKFSLAWAELGRAHSHEADWGWAPAVEGYERAREAVERALSLDPDLAEGHAGLAWIQLLHDWNWGGAEASVRRALELAPGDAEVLRRAGELARSLGRTEEAIGFFRRALEQDPLSAAAYHALGTVLHYSDRFTESEPAFRKALELAPQRAGSRAALSITLVALGRGEEALTEAKREPTEWARLWSLAIVHHAMGRRAESDAALRELIERRASDSAAQIAEVYATRGESDAAFEWLERAYLQRDSGISDSKSNSELRPLHGDPRWSAFLRKMGFEA
ncbi:MAG TPA: protein kinase [Candidatus Eisenbacteria bacterium]|nr:protein kinase [Candidatus Eisenbacteria bacterium]